MIQMTDLRHSFFQPKLILVFALIVLLSGCSSISTFFESTAPEDMNLALPPETLVKKGMEEYNRGRYFMAVEYFNKVLDSHRFTPQAILAELKLADCHYYMGKYSEAYVYYEQFEEMHPTNEAIPYVMYQKAMCYYKRIDTIDRDVTGAQESIEKFQLLLKAYPNSVYAKDAEAKVQAAREFLANHEFGVAQFYIRTDQQSQAIIRLKYLINVYPDAKIISKAETLLKDLEQRNS
jgi:outer membrane protein assembly factor BamD